jgi:hypothetical protein
MPVEVHMFTAQMLWDPCLAGDAAAFSALLPERGAPYPYNLVGRCRLIASKPEFESAPGFSAGA